MNKHYRKFLVYACIMTLILLSGCNRTSQAIEGPSSRSISVSNLIRSDGTFGWPDFQWDDSISEAEKHSGFTFPDIPYMSSEWSNLRVGETPSSFYDYKNKTDYDSVSYLAYNNEKPVAVYWGSALSYLSYEFQHGHLVSEMFYFGGEDSVRDPNMIFSESDNNTAEILNMLIDELTSQFGPPSGESTAGWDDQTETILYWDSPISEDGSYFTRISVSRLISEMDCVYLLIVKIPV